MVMPNLNYDGSKGVPQDGTQDGTRNVLQDARDNTVGDNIPVLIKKLIKKDNKISTEKMSIALGISVRTIKRRIKGMKEIQFIGRGSNGHWEISDEEK